MSQSTHANWYTNHTNSSNMNHILSTNSVHEDSNQWAGYQKTDVKVSIIDKFELKLRQNKTH